MANGLGAFVEGLSSGVPRGTQIGLVAQQQQAQQQQFAQQQQAQKQKQEFEEKIGRGSLALKMLDQAEGPDERGRFVAVIAPALNDALGTNFSQEFLSAPESRPFIHAAVDVFKRIESGKTPPKKGFSELATISVLANDAERKAIKESSAFIGFDDSKKSGAEGTFSFAGLMDGRPTFTKSKEPGFFDELGNRIQQTDFRGFIPRGTLGSIQAGVADTIAAETLVSSVEKQIGEIPSFVAGKFQTSAGKLTGGAVFPEAAQFENQRIAFATGLYKAMFRESRLSDQEQFQVAAPMIPSAFDSKQVRKQKLDTLREIIKARSGALEGKLSPQAQGFMASAMGMERIKESELIEKKILRPSDAVFSNMGDGFVPANTDPDVLRVIADLEGSSGR